MNLRKLWLSELALLLVLSLISGCKNENKNENNSENSGAGSAWATKTSMPTARVNPAVAVVNGVIFAIGGGTVDDGSGPVAIVEAYNPAADSWSTRTSMPTPRDASGVAVVNGIVYVIGGQDSSLNGLNVVEAYDPAGDSWTTKRAMPTARSGLAVVSVNSAIYAIGGVAVNNGVSPVLTTVEAYDTATDTWSTVSPMPTSRSELAAGVVNGIIYAIGGQNGSNNLATVEAYNPATNTWSALTPMSSTREAPSVDSIDGILYAVGGQNDGANNSGALLASMEAYDPLSGSWTAKPAMPTAREYARAGVANGKLYVIGGTGNTGKLATVEEYTP